MLPIGMRFYERLMIKYIYELKIHFNGNNSGTVTDILGVKPTRADDYLWELEITETDEEPYTDFINRFLDILDGKYSLLESVGIKRESITIWMYYEYDRECSMEFLPEDLKRIGSQGISLCISCWQSQIL